MAEGDGLIYTEFLEEVMKGSLAMNASDSFKVALCDSGYTPNYETHVAYVDLTNEETGTGYTAGGDALSTPTVTKGTGLAFFDAVDLTWTGLDVGTPAWAVLYDVTASNVLIATYEIATASNGSDYKLVWAATGLVQLT
jgi:hypothetical protein